MCLRTAPENQSKLRMHPPIRCHASSASVRQIDATRHDEGIIICNDTNEKLASSIPMKTILIVDDHQDTCDVLKLTLEHSGYTVFTATDGETAVALSRRHRPTFILLDYILDGALASSNVIDILKSEGIPSHVVLMSGIGDPKQKAIQLGAKHALKKPFDPEALYAVLDMLN